MSATLLALAAAVPPAVAILAGVVAHRFTTARRLAVTAPPGLDLGRDLVHFASRDGRVRIAAWCLTARPRRSAVILVHGKDAHRGAVFKACGVDLALALRDAGHTVLAIDLRGHGDSGPARLTYGDAERQDVLGAYDWLVERGHAPGTVGVVGVSMGAAAALLAAADEPGIGALFLDSPFTDFRSLMQRHFRKLSGGLPMAVMHVATPIARLLAGRDVAAVRPIDAARALRGRPVTVLHARGDRFVPVEHGRRIAEAAGVACIETGAGSHLGSYAVDPAAYTRAVLGFMGRHLDAGAAAAARGRRPAFAATPGDIQAAALALAPQGAILSA